MDSEINGLNTRSRKPTPNSKRQLGIVTDDICAVADSADFA
jgi:hypothetical protein